MGKANITGWIEDEAKAAIEDAVEPILGDKGSITALLQKFGDDCKKELDKLRADGNELRSGEFELIARIVPKKASAAKSG